MLGTTVEIHFLLYRFVLVGITPHFPQLMSSCGFWANWVNLRVQKRHYSQIPVREELMLMSV